MQLIAGCVLSACVFACDAADLIESTSKGWKAFANKPFSAVLVEYRRDSEAVYSKSRIYLRSVRAVRDSELSIWHCLDGDGKQHLQHFSTLLGVVIRQEFQDGRISELQDIAFIDDSGKYFQPSSDMQQISIEELITGRVTLPDFVE